MAVKVRQPLRVNTPYPEDVGLFNKLYLELDTVVFNFKDGTYPPDHIKLDERYWKLEGKSRVQRQWGLWIVYYTCI